MQATNLVAAQDPALRREARSRGWLRVPSCRRYPRTRSFETVCNTSTLAVCKNLLFLRGASISHPSIGGWVCEFEISREK